MTTLIRDMTLADYLAYPGISRSMIVDWQRSPEYFSARHVTGTIPSKPPTTDMEFGSMIDAWLTEDILPGPELPNGVVVAPAAVLTSDGKRFGKKYNAWLEDQPSGIVWTEKDVAKHREAQAANAQICLDIMGQIKAHDAARRLVLHPQRICQPSYVDIDIFHPRLRCKARPDIVTDQHIVDIKTSASVSAEFFAKQTAAFGYDIQAVLCQAAVHEARGRILPVIFVVIERDAPHQIECYELSQEYLQRGEDLIFRSLEQMDTAAKTNQYRSLSHGQIVTVDPPRYLEYREEYEYGEE